MRSYKASCICQKTYKSQSSYFWKSHKVLTGHNKQNELNKKGGELFPYLLLSAAIFGSTILNKVRGELNSFVHDWRQSGAQDNSSAVRAPVYLWTTNFRPATRKWSFLVCWFKYRVKQLISISNLKTLGVILDHCTFSVSLFVCCCLFLFLAP